MKNDIDWLIICGKKVIALNRVFRNSYQKMSNSR